MDGIWRQTDTDSPAWVNRLTIVVLALTLMYLIVGIPDLNHSAAAEEVATDAVDPIHRFAWLGLFAAALPVGAMRWRPTLALLRASWPLLLLYAYFGASTTWALDPEASLRRYVLAMMQLLQLAMLISGLKRAATLHVLLAGACVFGATADLLTLVVAPGFAMQEDGFAGLQLQKNQAGLMLMYGCLCVGSVYFLLQGRRTRLCIAGSVLMTAGLLVLTRSTTSQSVVLLAPVLMVLLPAIARLPTPGIWAISAGIIASLMAVAFFYLAWCGVTGTDPWLPLRGATFSSRTDIWSFVVDEIHKRPWFGSGFASFWAINPEVQPSLKTDQWFGTYAIINEGHNGYLDLLACDGIIGLVAGLAVVFRTLTMAGLAMARAEPPKVAWKTGQMAKPTALFHMVLLIGLLIHNFTESNLFATNSLLVTAFLITALDLEKWRIATRLPRQARYPNPAQFRPMRSRPGRLPGVTPTGLYPAHPPPPRRGKEDWTFGSTVPPGKPSLH